MRAFFTLEATQWQYLTGVADETLVNIPNAGTTTTICCRARGTTRFSSLCSATTRRIRRCTRECTNIFRATRVPLLAVWGRGDEIFGPAGAARVRH